MPGRTCGAPQLWHLGILDKEEEVEVEEDDTVAADAVAVARGHRTHEKGTLVSSRTLMLPGNRHVTGWMGLPVAAAAVAVADVVIGVVFGVDVALPRRLCIRPVEAHAR
jgi:hypothetical protein